VNLKVFKLAVISDEISQDLERAALVCKEYGCQGVEIRSVWNKPPHQLSAEDIAKIREILDRHGLRVCCIASPFFKCDLGNAEHYREHLEILRRCIDVAHQFGISLVRGFTFWRKGELEPVWDQIVQAFAEPLRILRQEGGVLGIENEASTYLGTGEEVARFLEQVGDGVLGAVWDPANQFHAQGPPPYPDGYNAIKARMLHFHIKDARWDEKEGKACNAPIGEGQIDYRGQIRALLEDNYSGYVSLETHWRPEALPEDLLNRPGGEAFSSRGEYASRLCLENLHRIIAEAQGGR